MKKISTITLLVICSILSGACKMADSVELEIKKWETLGWEFHETVGARLDDAIYLSHESSMALREFTAISTTDHGILMTKNYNMLKGGMLVVTMGRESQGCFSLVFTRFPEEPNKALHPTARSRPVDKRL